MAQIYHAMRGMVTQLRSQTEPHRASRPQGGREMLWHARVLAQQRGSGSCICELHINQSICFEFRLPLSSQAI